MATVYCAIYEDSNYWDGTTAWGYDATSDYCTPTAHANQAARDAQYTAAYTDVATWESARDGVAGAGDDEYGIIIGPWDNSDTLVEWQIAGWATGTITLRAIGDARFKGVKNTGVNGAWRTEAAEDKYFMRAGENNVTYDGLQLINTHATDALCPCFEQAVTGVTGLVISNCLFDCTLGAGIRINQASVTVTIFGCVVYISNVSSSGIHLDSATTYKVTNCTVHGFSTGLNYDAGTADVYNCIIFGCTNDVDGTPNTLTNCATDDGDGDNPQAPSGGDWANEMTGYAADDYELDAAGNCYDNGADDPLGDGSGSPDVAGTTRTSTWSIGAWEYDVVGGVAPTGTFFGPLYGPFRGVL